ncbi:uncharacterized protein FOMMEDRAFT_153610 [Fomitiporia mediterranea MF3/22]|uniref:uncharacterized protein n=1 Tax=Fomitiporia mediterranea (strain MF3/22) TaxID=694068 RepID=UPI0004407C97|nr:uncharacterized protein FOMMEDRAFT_153610 [Fomitiporia mediterranea MF3/22]EJD06209.1 hypothetical protein FOMMEDRAFT_153610 [Fomitiporia mediterranea MF3/22]
MGKAGACKSDNGSFAGVCMRRSHSGSSLSGDPDSTILSCLSSTSPSEDSNVPTSLSRDGSTHPINYIPSEVLSLIFIHCVSFPPDFTEPLILSEVCRKWRAVALQTPALWNTITLPIPGFDGGLPHIQIVEIFLKRSAALPLKVDLGLITGITPCSDSRRDLELRDEVVQTLAPHTNRIRVLENVMPNHLLHQFGISRLSCLEELLVCEDEKSGHVDYPVDGNQFSDTLRLLDLCGTMFDIRRVGLPQNLSELYVREPTGQGQVSVPQSIALFSALPRLTHCYLDITRQPETGAEIQGPLRVSMPNLEVFYFSWPRDIDIGPILDALVAPILSTLGLRAQYAATIPWNELVRFVERELPPLSIVSLVGSGNIHPGFAECLKNTPELENLTLSGFELGPSFLDALTLRHGKETSGLLPRLEYLDFEWCTCPDVGRLVSMLRSRGRDMPNQENCLEYFRMSTEALTKADIRQLQGCGIECCNIQRL